jgi:hypothetical protein
MSHSRRRSWPQALVRSWRGARTIRKTPARCWPSLEALEDRAVPTLSFGAAAAYGVSPGSSPHSVVTADLNGDGKLDLVTADSNSNSISVLLGNGNGTFQTAHTYSTVDSLLGFGKDPVAVAVGDFDGRHYANGLPILDLATGNLQDHSISVFVNNGDGTFQTPSNRNYQVGSAPEAIAVGDFNGDGLLDIVTANNGSSTVSVLLGTGADTFQAATSYATGNLPDSVAVGDFNRDGKLDLATANSNSNNVTVLLGNGNGTFQPAVGYPIGAGQTPSWIAAADLNGDGKLDLVTANSANNSVSVLLGNGNGTFQTAANYATGAGPAYIGVADLSKDGYPDLITANSSTFTVSALMNNGNGTFQPNIDFSTEPSLNTGKLPNSVATGDFNGDGKLDLAAAVSDGSNAVDVLFNTGVLSIGSNQTTITGTEGSLVTTAGPLDDPFGPAAVTLTASLGAVVKNTTNTGWTWSYTPPVGPAGPTTVTITATDTHSQTTSTSFTLTVNNVAPTITKFSVPTAGAAGSPVLLSGAATDPGGVNDPLTYTWTVGRPDGTTLTLNGANASFTPSIVGFYQVALSVTDSGGATTTVAAPPSGLVSWYRGEGNANDAMNRNPGVLVNGVTFAAGEVGQAFNFNGANEVQVPDAPNLDLTNAVTLEAWIKPSSLALSNGFGTIIAKSGGGGRNYGLFLQSNGGLFLSYQISAGFIPLNTAANVIPVGQFSHVAGVINTLSGSEQIYVNGQLISSQTIGGGGPMVTNTQPLSIGQDNGSSGFLGLIDEPSVYNRALSQGAIQSIFNAGNAGKPLPTLVLVTPVVIPNSGSLPINAAQMTINGAGFDPTAAHNTVTFNDGAVGSVTAATATSLTVTFSTKPAKVGSLTAIVNTDGLSSGAAVQVATVTPVVTSSTSLLAFNAPQITINGFGFDSTSANNTVTFNDGAVGSVTAASATSLTVTFSTPPVTAGSLSAIVSTDGVSSGAAVQVASASVVTVTGLTIPAGAEGSLVTLSATATDSVSALTYTWTITAPPGAGSNFTLTGASVSFTPPDEGNYGVSLTVRDAAGGSNNLPTAGLISSYRGEGNALDVRGANNGTVVGGVTYVAGKVGQAFSFDGSTGYVQLPANFLPYPTSGTGNAPLTFETWFRTPTSSGGVILGQQASAAFGPIGGGWIPAVYVGTDGHLYAQMFWNGGAETPIVSNALVNDNQFHHVAVTYNGTSETVYLDGVAIGTQALTQVAYAGSYNYQLGLGITSFWPAGNGGWFPFKGQIDEPSFYNRALSAAEVQSIANAGSAGKFPAVAVANVSPTPTLSGFTTDLATEVVTYTFSATDPSTTDVAGFTYTVNWGDGSALQTSAPTPGNGSGVRATHVFTTAGTYNVALTATDEDGGATTITRTVTILTVTSANLQTVINQQGSITFQVASDAQAQAVVTAVNGLAAQTVSITLNLGSANYTDLTPSPQAGIKLTISGSAGTTIIGHSPALDVAGGDVIIDNLTLITDTDSPTVKVSGGNLKLHDVHIEGNGSGSQPALDITGGNVDLGTANDPGGNTFNAHGNGELIHNGGPNGVDAVGDMFETDGTPLTSPFRIKDKIFDALNAGGGGPVTYVPGNLYISVSGGDIQRGIDAVATGGTVNVEAGGSYQSYVTGSKLVTVAFQNGPVLTQEADAFAPSKRTLVVTGTPGNDKILFNPGTGPAGTVKVLVNNLPQGLFSPTGRLIAYGMAGNDDIEVASGITLSAWLYGGAGNDRLKGGGGNNVLVGGAGDNELIGGPRNDLMIGGSGPSTLLGTGGNDLMIAGTTAFDANEAALSAIMAEWTSGRSYADRIANLSGTGSGLRANGSDFLIASGPSATVFDNGVSDVLHGGSGMDWFFANLAQDLLHGRHGWQIVENL